MRDTTIVYFNPAEDSEWPIHDGDDKCETCNLPYGFYDRPRARTVPESAGHFCKDCNESFPVSLAFNLEDNRGHYLTADFVLEAIELLKARRVTVTLDLAEGLFEAGKCADAYNNHNKVSSNDECTNQGYLTCECEYIHDEADHVEAILRDYGFIVIWNDGVYVYERLERPTTD